MDEQKVDYAIYPSLLDAYLRYKKNDDEETFISLFNRINKVPQDEVPEHVLKGIEFEKTVNFILAGNKVDADVHTSVLEQVTHKLSNQTGMQKYEETIIDTPVGRIKLYGIIDYDFPDMIVDLKTVVEYSCNKYEKYAQHPTYALIRKNNGQPIKAFKYLITDFKRVYQETYIPTEQMYQKLMFTIYEFIAFINHFKKHITNTKIFGGEEYVTQG